MSGLPAVELRDVTKDFVVGVRGMRLRAVDRLSLTIGQGQIFGLLGPNGSGKSTTIKMLLGFTLPSAGQCSIFGVPCDRPESRILVGYLPESPEYYRYLTGQELLAYFGRLCGLCGERLVSRVAEVIDTVGLTHAAKRRVGTYSKGMLQRIGLAQAIVHDPKLIILDEPTAGVDPVAASAIAELLLRLRSEGKTILVTSHLLDQVEDICDRVAFLDRGRLILEGSVCDLTQAHATASLCVDSLSGLERSELDGWLRSRGHPTISVGEKRGRIDRLFRDHVNAVALAPRNGACTSGPLDSPR